MKLKDLIQELQDQGLTEEQILKDQRVIDLKRETAEPDFQTAAASQDANVVAPGKASETQNTELESEDGSSESLIPEEELLKINEKVTSLDLNTSVEKKRLGGKFSQDFSVDVIPYEEQRVEAEKNSQSRS